MIFLLSVQIHVWKILPLKSNIQTKGRLNTVQIVDCFIACQKSISNLCHQFSLCTTLNSKPMRIYTSYIFLYVIKSNPSLVKVSGTHKVLNKFLFFFLILKIHYYICTSIENDHLGDWSPQKDFCCLLMFQQPVRSPSSESSVPFSQLKIEKLL